MNWRNDSGQSVGPEMMLILVFALAAWGLLAWIGRLTSSSQDMANTAQSGARAASIAPDPVSAQIAARAAVAASNLPTPCADSPSVAMALAAWRRRRLVGRQRHRHLVVQPRQR